MTPPTDPYATAIAFLATAVERRHVGISYGLVLPSLRGAETCGEWASGKLPFPVFRRIDWNRSGYKVVTQGRGQVVLRVFLRHVGGNAPPKWFIMDVRQPEGDTHWLVGFFDVVG